ncbi:hypothetical protein PNOK_0314000 [Pyrrhoderma noxium]|uniref:Uncharacterized protein n=1 Tax=Pyrrhoderma noxium TaxID=2282107 RepID=A0A286ULP0_9AGAM|nr:hypothetical protein PNOK_0314000 [Pyrrhoderma noxium]
MAYWRYLSSMVSELCQWTYKAPLRWRAARSHLQCFKIAGQNSSQFYYSVLISISSSRTMIIFFLDELPARSRMADKGVRDDSKYYSRRGLIMLGFVEPFI